MEKFEFGLLDIVNEPVYTKVFVVEGFEIKEFFFLGFQPTPTEIEFKYRVLLTDDLNEIRVKDIRNDETVYYLEWGFAVNELIRRLEDRLNFVKKNWI